MRRSVLVGLFAATVLLLLPVSAHATTRYVKTTGSDTAGTGSSTSPYKTVQKAISVSVSGDVVNVGPGTFTGSITMRNGVSISGAGDQATVLAASTSSGPAVTATNITAVTHISGVKIAGATAGLGISCTNSSLTISNNWVTGNVVGIRCEGPLSPVISGNDVTGNTANGIVCNSCSPTVAGNYIGQNHAAGILCTATALPLISDNTIDSNWERGIECNGSSPIIIINRIWSNPRGIVCANSSAPTIQGNTITGATYAIECNASFPDISGNTISGASTDGIWCRNGSSVNITGNTLKGNSTGIACDASSVTVAGCAIVGNGVGQSNYGVSVLSSGSADVSACTISASSHNVWCDGSSLKIEASSLNDGYFGMDSRVASLTVTNCTISGNVRGIESDSSTLTVVNDTLYGNTSTGVNCTGISSASIVNCILWNPGATELTNCSATYSDIHNGGAGTGNISVDPSFEDTATFRLQAGSPCVDAGTSTAAPTTDKEGTPRPQYGGWDIGALERHPVTCRLHYAAADANGSIAASATQIVTFGGSGTAVTAAPMQGFYFAQWSDGSTANPRADTKVTEDATYTASFATCTPTAIAVTSTSNLSLAYGGAFTVRGTLKANGVGLVGQRVTLQARLPGALFADTAYTALTTTGGVFCFTMKPTTRVDYRVRFAAQSVYGASGPTEYVQAMPRAYAYNPVAPLTMYRTRYCAVYGYLRPRHTAGTYPMRIYKYRYVSGVWRSYGYTNAKAYNYLTYTKCVASLRLPYAGRWRLRAYAPADAGHAAAWSSGYDYVTVR